MRVKLMQRIRSPKCITVSGGELWIKYNFIITLQKFYIFYFYGKSIPESCSLEILENLTNFWVISSWERIQ